MPDNTDNSRVIVTITSTLDETVDNESLGYSGLTMTTCPGGYDEAS